MTTKFTPGPWYLNGTDKGPGQYYMHIGAKGSPMNLASINECHTQSIANSHLIAAAPDLYEALKEIMNGRSMDSDLREQCKLALAKARGENQ